MRVLITGGAGFIGGHIADATLAAGYETCVIDDLSSGRRENVPSGARFEEIDLRDAEAVNRVVHDFKPDVVSHQGAQTSVSVSTREPLRDASINVIGGLNLLEACKAEAVQHLVFASTGGAIYGDIPDGERAELGREELPISPYACSKLAYEVYLRAAREADGFRSTVLRYANVYGPRQDPHGEAGVVAIFCKRLLAGQHLQINARREAGDRGCVRDYVYVSDVVDANLRAMRGEFEATTLNVGTGEGCETQTLAEHLSRALGLEPELTYGAIRAGDIERSVLVPAPELSTPFVSLEDGLGKTMAWFKARHEAS